MTQRALILLHPGLEEMEAVAPIDLLSRAGIDVVQASTHDQRVVEGRSGITLQAHCLLSELQNQDFDLIILPGGPGIQKLRDDPRIIECLKRQDERRQLIAAICAAPLLLKDAGLIESIQYTAHPSTQDELKNARDEAVVIDGHTITSRGAGTATEFALNLVAQLRDNSVANQIAESIGWSHSY